MNRVPAKRGGDHRQLPLWTREGAPSQGLDGAALAGLELRVPRIIHYLGSKQRLLSPIRAAVHEVVAPGGRVCDLFAGSGTVSFDLASRWNVLSVDIQEYSRVLCEALLNRPRTARETLDAVLQAAESGGFRSCLRSALSAVMAHEEASLRAAARGEPEPLCDLLTDGPLISVEREDGLPSSRFTLLKRRALEALRKLRHASGPSTVVTRQFGGVYFSWEQAIDLDALLQEIHGLDGALKDHYLAALLAVASEVVNTIGKQFAQPIRPRDASGRPKQHLVKQTIRDRTISIFDSFAGWIERLGSIPNLPGDHEAVRRDYRELLEDGSVSFDAVYADPPYTRDHYSRFYHVLETMALHDEPRVSTTTIRTGGHTRLSRGMYRVDRHQSPFCIKSQAPGAFEAMFRAIVARGVPLVLSYSPYNSDTGNRPRLLTVDELLSLAEAHFGRVECRSVGSFAHNKLNVTERNVDVNYQAEVLLVCRP